MTAPVRCVLVHHGKRVDAGFHTTIDLADPDKAHAWLEDQLRRAIWAEGLNPDRHKRDYCLDWTRTDLPDAPTMTVRLV